MTRTHKIILSILSALVLLWAYIALDKRSNSGAQPLNIATTTDTNTVKTGEASVSGNVSGTGSYTIEQVDGSGVPQPIPDLNRPVRPLGSATVTTEAIVRATEKILPLQAELKKDPSNFSAWMNLALYQKMAGDYQGAVITWQYAGKLSPADYISVGNLGNLYGYFLKDNVKAESYFKLAISKAPTQASTYIQLAEFYWDVLKDLNKARNIVDQGLDAIPNNTNLLQLKATLQ